MGNPEKLAALSTQDTGQIQTKQKTQQKKTKKMSNADPTKYKSALKKHCFIITGTFYCTNVNPILF